MSQLYAIGLGSNRPHGRYGMPAKVLDAVLHELQPVAASGIIETAPIGPSLRTFANAAALIETELSPPELLRHLKAIERRFGRRRGQRWGARVLDLDILLWSGGLWSDATLTIPHRDLTERLFALDPLSQIAPEWKIPHHGTVRQHFARLARPRPTHRSGRRQVRSSVGRANDF
ncbi:MAG: 2-amino-4-hydroxy-6-hydroxymethyldihydropteridine diphosphokinase [Sphingomonas sp.]|nr:2-amino-4-hydroxy-6-hydroxymethyldihydropteridine diphosphokinase [Sphingomonas sp.]